MCGMWHHFEKVMSQQQVVSKSLIVTPRKSLIPNSLCCLGLPEWCLCCIYKDKMKDTTVKLKYLKLKPPSAQCVQVPLSKKPIESTTRRGNDAEHFNFDMTVEELDAFKEKTCPANTTKNTEWAIQTVESRRAAKTESISRISVPQIY